MQLRRTPQLTVTFLSITIFFLLPFAVPQASAQITCELHEKGFWRNNPADWPVTSLQLGSNTYTQQQLLTILATRVGGDASVMLAQQLIAALLNIENGTDPAPVDATIDHANSLLGGGTIPEGIRPNTTVGKQMVSDAKVLENYNQGLLTQPCGCTPGTPGCGWATGDMLTATQTTWGDSGSAAGGLLSSNFGSLYGSALVIGGTHTITLTSATAVFNYLPAVGPAGPLTGSSQNPLTTSSGELGGEVLGLQLNVDFSAASLLPSATPLGDLRFCNFTDLPSLNSQTVSDFLATANHILGGGSAPFGASTAAAVANLINGAFVNGVPSTFAQNNLRVGGCGWENGDMVTYGHAQWGTTGTTADGLLNTSFNTVYFGTGGVLEVGISGTSGFSIQFSGGAAIATYLPSTGTPAALTGDVVNPTTTSSGILGGELTTLSLNVDYSAAGLLGGSVTTDFGDLNICGAGTVPNMSVTTFLAIAENTLGGANNGYSPATILSVAQSLNGAFQDGAPSAFAQDHLVIGACP